MRRPLTVFTLLALLVVAWSLAQKQTNDRPYTTTSTKAYALYVQGDEQLQSFQWAKAEESLRKALELDPGFAMAQASYAVLMRSHGRSGQMKEAVARAESLAALLPDENERLLVLLRMAQFGMLQPSPRDSLIDVLEERLPEHPIVLSARAMVAMENRQGEKAAEIWRKLLEVDPNHARAYNWLGYNAAYMGRYDEALSYLRKYAYLAPELANPHDSLGEILSYIGEYGEAADEFRRALEIQPDFFISLVNLAQVYIDQGRIQKGVEILEQVRGEIAGTEFEKEIDRRLIGVYYAHDMVPDLSDAVVRYSTRYPDDIYGAFYRSMRLAGMGEIEDGRALCDSFLAAAAAEDRFQGNEAGRQNLARLKYTAWATFAEAQNDAEAAAEYWGKALAHAQILPPHHQHMFRIHYGEALAETGRHEEALQQADACLAVNPRILRALALRSEACLALNRWDEASKTLASLEAALAAADPQHPLVAKAGSLRRALDERTSS